MRSSRRLAASVGALLAVAGLAACSAPLPATVVPGTSVVAGWSGELTSFNAAAAPTAGNLDIAAVTRGRFGDMVDGDFVADESFGTVSIVGDDPFTVRYDLAQPSWSDGIPVDAADLLLDWAAGAGYFDEVADAADAAADEPSVPQVDEFSRAIDVTFAQPTIEWQTAVSAPVPAHVVGERAFGLDDPMEAKQAVIRAIQDDDAAALDDIAAVWRNGFDLPTSGGIPDDLRVSSGPFQIDDVTEAADATDAADGQSVTLVPNPDYRGAVTPQVARVELVPPGADPLSAIGDQLDIAQLAPLPENHTAVHDLERQDFTVQTTDDGTVWSVLLSSSGLFADPAARAAFLRFLPADDMIQSAAGEWASAYTKTTSMLVDPASSAYEVVNEDSGFTAALGTPADDAAQDRDAARVAAGTPVCVLYDRSSTFASGAFGALRDAAGEAGWAITDCGSDDVAAARGGGGWDAVIDRVPLPQSMTQLADQWGSWGEASVIGPSDPQRDELITQLEQTVDVYAARELLAQIEGTIVRAAVARPLAVNPVVTISDRDVTGVTVRNGPAATLTAGMAQWAVVP